MNQTENKNEAICIFEETYKVILLFLLGSTSLVAVIENAFFCFAVYFNKKLHFKSNILVVSLAITDIIIAAILPNLEIVYLYFYPSWPIGSLGTKTLNLIWIFSLVCPFVTVTAITIERYVMIAGKSSWKVFFTKRIYMVIVIFIWLYSFICCLVTAVTMQPAHKNEYIWNVNPTLYYILLGFHIVVPLLLLPGFYYKMKSASQYFLKKLMKITENNVNLSRQRKEMKLAKTIFIIIGLMYLVWSPVVIIEILYNLQFKVCIVSKLGVISLWITCINGCLNPMVYSYRNPEVKKFAKCVINFFYKIFAKENKAIKYASHWKEQVLEYDIKI
ncbi:adrenocorticotropic hormone receptor-like [Hydra vulgaris]|uniref:Adrenocorticotropic hormone receptor-like n=1 Tax=Hydra vulgaris TaxID=6087 RepID=A0ABM4DQG7_HYDVU